MYVAHLNESAEGGVGGVMRDEEAHIFVAQLNGGRPVHPGHTLKLTSLRNPLPDWASLHGPKQDTRCPKSSFRSSLPRSVS